ncbi:MAG: hypothetical protein K2Q01_10215, partial [Rickettsiales bacterium]|nr:hypothetical protein [Rickettsiales bacterium]
MQGLLVGILGVLAAGYAALLSYLYLNQRRMVFQPDTQIAAPEAYGLSGFEELFIRKDGQALQLWHRAPAP